MSDCAIQKSRFETLTPLALEAAFDGGRLTSDGGLTWLAEADRELSLCETIASDVPEWRATSVRHSLVTLVRQRVFQIACGYEDQNDSNSLRTDPLLKLVCGRLPETGTDLASQPTISRLENAVTARSCYRIAQSACGTLHPRASEGWCSFSPPFGLRRHRRSCSRRARRSLLPRLLRGTYPPSASHLRRADKPAHHCRVETRQHPRQPRSFGSLEAHRKAA